VHVKLTRVRRWLHRHVTAHSTLVQFMAGSCWSGHGSYYWTVLGNYLLNRACLLPVEMVMVFYVYVSVHRWPILIIVQRNATQSSLFIILQDHSTCFGCQPHLSSGSWQLSVQQFRAFTFWTGHVCYLLNRSCLLPVEMFMAITGSAAHGSYLLHRSWHLPVEQFMASNCRKGRSCFLWCSSWQFFFSVALRSNADHGLLVLEISWSHTTTHHSR